MVALIPPSPPPPSKCIYHRPQLASSFRSRRRRLDIIRFNHLSIFPLPGEWLSLICFLARKRPRGIPSRGFFWNSSWSRLTRPPARRTVPFNSVLDSVYSFSRGVARVPLADKRQLRLFMADGMYSTRRQRRRQRYNPQTRCHCSEWRTVVFSKLGRCTDDLTGLSPHLPRLDDSRRSHIVAHHDDGSMACMDRDLHFGVRRP